MASGAQIASLEQALDHAVNSALTGTMPAADLIRAVALELLGTIPPPPIKLASKVTAEDDQHRDGVEGQHDDVAGEAWSVASFMRSIGLDEVIGAALQPPARGQFAYMRSLERGTLLELLARARLEGLCDAIWAGLLRLRQQEEATGAELSAKFAMTSHTLALGELPYFFGGLEALIGPPLMVDGSLEKSMLLEHDDPRDRDVEFLSSNGVCPASPFLPVPHQASLSGAQRPPPGLWFRRSALVLKSRVGVRRQPRHGQDVRRAWRPGGQLRAGALAATLAPRVVPQAADAQGARDAQGREER